MSDTPLTPPYEGGPYTPSQTPPPTSQVATIGGNLTPSAQAISDAITSRMASAAEALATCEQRLDAALRSAIADIAAVHEATASAIDVPILALLSRAAGVLADLGCPAPTIDEIAARAAALDWGRALIPPLPNPPPGIPPFAWPQAAPGNPLGPFPGAPQLAPIPAPLMRYGTLPGGRMPAGTPAPGPAPRASSTSSPATSSAPIAGTPPLPVPTRSGGETILRVPTPQQPYTPGIAPKAPAAPGSPDLGQRTTYPYDTPGRLPSDLARPGAGGVDYGPGALAAPLAPDAGAGGQGGSGGQYGAVGAPVSGGGAVPGGASGCPPITVNVRCAPGTTADVGVDSNGGAATDPTRPRNIRVAAAGDDRDDDPLKLPPEEGPPPRVLGDGDEVDDLNAWLNTPAEEAFRAWLDQNPDDVAAAPDVCDTGEEWRDDLKESMTAFWKWLTGSPDGRQIHRDSFLGHLVHDSANLVPGPFLRGLGLMIAAVVRGGADITQLLTGCDDPQIVAPVIARSIVGVIQRWIGAPLPEVHTQLDQLIGQTCATRLPGTGEAHRTYYAGLIPAEVWECWVRANGDRPDEQQLVAEAGRTRVGPGDVVRLHQRGVLTREEADRRLRELGVTRPNEGTDFFTLARYIPGAGDLVRFMVRDVADPAVVRKFGYDAEFDQKFQGNLAAWARAQGIDREVMLDYWRAHWQLPGTGQGYTMMHRLRPGRVPEDVVTTDKTVEQLLAVNDVPEYWRKRLLAISYHPITRLDLRLGYTQGSFDDQEVIEGLQDQGMTEANARLLLRSWRRRRVDWIKARPYVKAYGKGAMTDEELQRQIAQDGLEGPMAAEAAIAAKAALREATRAACVKGLHREFLVGLISEDTVIARLQDQDFNLAQAVELRTQWQCEKAAKGKIAPSATLCKWSKLGLLSADQFLGTLMRLGWNIEQARLIMAECQIGIRAEQRKVADRAALAQQRRTKEAQRTVDRRSQQQQAATARAARQAQQRTRQEERVQKVLHKVTMTVAKNVSKEPQAVKPAVDRLFTFLVTQKRFSRQGAADLVAELAGPESKRHPNNWEEQAERYMQALPARPEPGGTKDAEKPAGAGANT